MHGYQLGSGSYYTLGIQNSLAYRTFAAAHMRQFLQHSPVSMTDLSKKIHAVTQDLKRLQQEMQSSTRGSEARLAELDSAALNEFKNVVDYVRQLIWTYLQAESLQRGKDIDQEVRSLRLKHVTEMLQTIRQEVKSRELEPSPAATSFLNAVQEIADAAFQRHKPEASSKHHSGERFGT